MNPTFDRLCAILARDYKLDAGQITPQTALESLGVDSLGVADLLFTIEDAFGIILPPDPVQLTTVGDVAGFIDTLLAAQAAGSPPGGGPACASPLPLP